MTGVQQFTPAQESEPHITLTSQAVEHFQNMLKESPHHFIVFDIKKTGCSGFEYSTRLVDSLDEQLHIISPEYLLPLYISQKAIPILNGLTIDYVKLPLSQKGLVQKGLTYTNPNETGRCGCGESFTVDPQFSGKESKRA
jgi:iron-sulfur cluster assembly protein